MDSKPTAKAYLHWTGLVLGPLLCALALAILPTHFQLAGSSELSEFSWAGRATLAVMIWMGVWWLTEAVHISVTALLPIVVFPLLGAARIPDACSPYADPLIFLYFGGFVIALSMERWGLGKRIALQTLRWVGTSASAMVAGFMLVTAGLSAFVSNTATTAMMLPIAASVVALLKSSAHSDAPNASQQEGASSAGIDSFGTCLMLAVAYSASVGGIMTIIGTPPNAFLIGFVRDKIAAEYRQDFGFAGWLPIGVTLAAVFLPLIYLVLTRFLFPIQGVALAGGQQLVQRQLSQLGRVQRGEWNTLAVFLITVLLWLVRPMLSKLQFSLGGSLVTPFANLTDTGVAMSGAMLLFLLPANFRQRIFTMDWEHASRIPWGILLLFGGGLSLAAAVQANGVAEFIGSQTGALAALPPLLLVLLVTAAIVFLTELTSNAATTASLVPVLAALAPGLGVHPYLLIFPATLAASCAFMLPVATPPNAIVFASGMITIPQMIRAGIVLNLIAIAIITILTMLVIRPWLGLS
ncbi:MAG: SLC13/DASS family transporter [Planctomycetales bacterium]|nr:SLC13/DASS family transporter [Planctomycetales bacterium]